MRTIDLADRVRGVLLGTAVGDALGLPYEGMSRRRANRWKDGRPLRHRFVFGRGMVSDDTEHTCMAAQALLTAGDDPRKFARSLAWRLRFWLLGLPAGIGRATARAILKLWIGFPPESSGVYSAGNGPAMRAAVLGVCLGENPRLLSEFIRASTRLTHSDARAQRGALLVAYAAHYGAHRGAPTDANEFLAGARHFLGELDDELSNILDQLARHYREGAPVRVLVDTFGLSRGVTGYIYHTVPVCIYGWLRSSGNFRNGLEEIIALGGDTDTTGAIFGGICGATYGASCIPDEWVRGIIEWPRSVGWMNHLASRLAKRIANGAMDSARPLRLFWPALVPRNLLFLAVVLVHAVRRLAPPY